MRQIQELRIDTRHYLFPAPLGIALIPFATRSNGVLMSTGFNIFTPLLALRYIFLSGAWVPDAEPLFIHQFITTLIVNITTVSTPTLLVLIVYKRSSYLGTERYLEIYTGIYVY